MKIALFGAGRAGVRILHYIGKKRICFFIDNNQSGEIEEIPIISLHQISEEEKENLLILITSKRYKDEMIAQLEKNNCMNYLVYTDASIPMHDNHQRLSEEGWGDLYNESILEQIAENLQKDKLSVQTQELIKITQEGEKILEIGCGSGETSLALAKRGRRVTAIDYSPKSIALVNKLVKHTGYMVDTYCLDALKELPFKDREFDVVFQAGLLEHFEKYQRIEMLQKWRRVCKRMISLIPNAHCLAYRAGKVLAEENKTWVWGLEMPQGTLIDEFQKAGYIDISEYSIGERHALNFLENNHYLRVAINRWLDENKDMSDWGQGYLLVTTGNNFE